MTAFAERFEDMSQRGRLRIWQQEDGDMIVEIVPDPNRREIVRFGNPAHVEFCQPGFGGGKSPRTVEALRALMRAMADDNADPACSGRRGERGLNGTHG